MVLEMNFNAFDFQLLYNYLKFNGEWLLQRLNVSNIELSEFKSLPGQNTKEEKIGLLQSMFHIGHQPFDQVSFSLFSKSTMYPSFIR